MIIERDIKLVDFNTFHLDAVATFFCRVQNREDLETALSFSQEQKVPAMVLGGGSNLLFTGDYDGLVLKNEVRGIELTREDDDHIYIKAGAGENWHQLVLFCVNRNYAGIENLSLIPGNVGASPMQNIGAYGVEIKDVFYELEAFHVQDRVVQRFSLKDCGFGYRESVFKNKYKNQFVILNVTLRLNKNPSFHTSYGVVSQELEKMGVKALSIHAISQAIINIRSSKLPDPAQTGNAGSFFKNPVVSNQTFETLKQQFPALVAFPSGQGQTKLAAGWLIEQCGWKGYRKGDAGCYPKQALVLVNYGHAKGSEILELSEEIIQSVQNRFGVTLEREVNII